MTTPRSLANEILGEDGAFVVAVSELGKQSAEMRELRASLDEYKKRLHGVHQVLDLDNLTNEQAAGNVVAVAAAVVAERDALRTSLDRAKRVLRAVEWCQKVGTVLI